MKALSTPSTGRRSSVVRSKPSDAAQGVVRHSAVVAQVLNYYRKSKIDPLRTCLRLVEGRGAASVVTQLALLPVEWQDYAIACVYSVLISARRRKRLGAYFTPPHLVAHLLARMQSLGLKIGKDNIRDPAAGGAAFIVPIARRLAAQLKRRRTPGAKLVSEVQRQLSGTEIDPGLATVANALLRRMLHREYGLKLALLKNVKIVQIGNSLSSREASRDSTKALHEIGNPPYRRLSANEGKRISKRFSDVTSGRLNLYSLFVRAALDHVAPGGMVGHIIPASFLGGPEFTAFRSKVSELACVEVLDLIHQRTSVFLDAEQDACFIVLRRRPSIEPNPKPHFAISAIVGPDGESTEAGRAIIASNGEPWALPHSQALKKADRECRLSDWGYQVRVGYLVANRQKSRLASRAAKGRYPLVWAKAIQQNGKFNHDRGAKARKYGWASAPDDARYVVRKSCVLVQRTTSRDQRKRLVAAHVPSAFIKEHGGFIAENHVLILIPNSRSSPSPARLSAVLNSPTTSAELDRICGSASLAIDILNRLPLPSPYPQVSKTLKAVGKVGEAKRASSSRDHAPRLPPRLARNVGHSTTYGAVTSFAD